MLTTGSSLFRHTSRSSLSRRWCYLGCAAGLSDTFPAVVPYYCNKSGRSTLDARRHFYYRRDDLRLVILVISNNMQRNAEHTSLICTNGAENGNASLFTVDSSTDSKLVLAYKKWMSTVHP
jgi:hypothetical protein